MTESFSILNLVTFLPVVGVVIILILPRKWHNAIRWTALLASLVTFAFSIKMLADFNINDPELQMVQEVSWISVLDGTSSTPWASMG